MALSQKRAIASNKSFALGSANILLWSPRVFCSTQSHMNPTNKWGFYNGGKVGFLPSETFPLEEHVGVNDLPCQSGVLFFLSCSAQTNYGNFIAS